MSIISDYHIHTKLCGHAIGELSEYADQAIKTGLKEIGISDHAPLVSHENPEITMSFYDLPVYHKMIEALKSEYSGKLLIKFGIEADFIEGYEDKTKAILDAYPYDYVIGSVHYVDMWGFDNPDEQDKWKEKKISSVYRAYHENLQKCALSGMYDIMGHVDLVKKYGHRPDEDITAVVEETARVFKESNVAIEINTSGLRKPVGEIYPSLSDLKIYCAAGIPIVFGSDSHAPNQVGCDYDKALIYAGSAGYKEYALFKERKIDSMVGL
ncbi:MAG: histidinol-phosphatase HisJ [Candidatus Omnitrophica bacterium]|nr:histidinol-phosphatase HisJ [Candidatus Omnitrophota bacterium]MBU4332990.1 histidinol-phosphatase HisJ [Candidatus Omnitrophota bacterium]